MGIDIKPYIKNREFYDYIAISADDSESDICRKALYTNWIVYARTGYQPQEVECDPSVSANGLMGFLCNQMSDNSEWCSAMKLNVTDSPSLMRQKQYMINAYVHKRFGYQPERVNAQEIGLTPEDIPKHVDYSAQMKEEIRSVVREENTYAAQNRIAYEQAMWRAEARALEEGL